MDWYPWYPQIYEQDTMHLTPYQDGCYRRLIDHYMKTRVALPDNDSALARIVGDSEANWVAMASAMVRPFFEAQKGRLYLKRCEDVLTYQDNKVQKLSESGKKGAEKRWNKINDKDSNPIATPMATLKPVDSTRQDNIEQDIYIYPKFIKVDGATHPARNVDPDEFSKEYLKIIKKDRQQHEKVKEIVKYLSSKNLIKKGLGRFIKERDWEAWEEEYYKYKANDNLNNNGRVSL